MNKNFAAHMQHTLMGIRQIYFVSETKKKGLIGSLHLHIYTRAQGRNHGRLSGKVRMLALRECQVPVG